MYVQEALHSSFLTLCIDDILLIENDVETLLSVKTNLSTQLSKDVGEASYIFLELSFQEIRSKEY